MADASVVNIENVAGGHDGKSSNTSATKQENVTKVQEECLQEVPQKQAEVPKETDKEKPQDKQELQQLNDVKTVDQQGQPEIHEEEEEDNLEESQHLNPVNSHENENNLKKCHSDTITAVWLANSIAILILFIIMAMLGLILSTMYFREGSIENFVFTLGSALIPVVAVTGVGCVWKFYIHGGSDFRILLCLGAILGAVLQTVIQIIVFSTYTDHSLITVTFRALTLTIAAANIAYAVYLFKNNTPDIPLSVVLPKIFLMCLSIVLYVQDIFSDFSLGLWYLWQGKILFFILTMSFIVLPGVFITWDNFRLPAKIKTVFLCCFNLEPVFMYMQSMKLAKMSKIAENSGNTDDQVTHFKEMLNNDLKICRSRENEAIMEAVPQLCLQISILYSTWQPKHINSTKILQLLCIATSTIGIVGSIVSHNKLRRIKQYTNDPYTIVGVLVDFMSWFPTIASRIVTVSCLSYTHPVSVVLGVLVHWSEVALWVYLYYIPKHRKNVKSRLHKIVFSMTFSVEFTFRPCRSTTLYVYVFHVIFFLENIAAMIAWGLSSSPEIRTSSLFIFEIFISIVGPIIGFVCHVLLDKFKDKFCDWSKVPESKRPP